MKEKTYYTIYKNNNTLLCSSDDIDDVIKEFLKDNGTQYEDYGSIECVDAIKNSFPNFANRIKLKINETGDFYTIYERNVLYEDFGCNENSNVEKEAFADLCNVWAQIAY